MRLSVCVTRYKEPGFYLKRLLDSIAIQQNVNLEDIEVVVVIDGDEPLFIADVLPRYPFRITVKRIKHSGVGVARNTAIDTAEGEYVMLCDVDDMFCSVYALMLIEQKIAKGADLIRCDFVEELKEGDRISLVPHKEDITFVHGKVMRKAFLREKDLKFDEELTIHEDGFFNSLVALESENTETISTPVYVWKWRDDSIVRTNTDAFLLRTYEHLVKSRMLTLREMLKRGHKTVFISSAVKTITDMYYDFQKPEFRSRKRKSYIAEATASVKAFISLYIDFYNTLPSEYFYASLTKSRELALKNGFKTESETFKEWLNGLGFKIASL